MTTVLDSDLRLPVVPGMGPEITLFLSMLSAARRELVGMLEGLSEDDLLWVPPGGKRSIGRILRHVISDELLWMREYFGGLSAGEELWALAARDPSTGKDLPLPRAPLTAYLRDLDRVRHESLRALEVSRDAALDTDYEHPTVKGPRAQGRWILYHVLEHEAYHRGQIAAIKSRVGRRRKKA